MLSRLSRLSRLTNCLLYLRRPDCIMIMSRLQVFFYSGTNPRFSAIDLASTTGTQKGGVLYYVEARMKVYFYTLSDPTTKEICYVGQTNDPDRRKKQHFDVNATGNLLKLLWVRALTSENLRPVFTIILECDDTSISPKEYEAELIEKYWNRGCPLLNIMSAKNHRNITRKTIYNDYVKRIRSSRFYVEHKMQYYE
jgi:hypothetical protein